MQGPPQSYSDLSNAGPPPKGQTPSPAFNYQAHEDAHTDARILRYTDSTFTNARTGLRMVFKRPRYLLGFWWGFETADSANDIGLDVLLNGVSQGTFTVRQGDTESAIGDGYLDQPVTETDVITLYISGTPTDATGPWWAEIEVGEAFV